MNSPQIPFSIIAKYSVRDGNGKFSFEKSLENFASRLTEYESYIEKDLSISDAVNIVFDSYPEGSFISFDELIVQVIPLLSNKCSENFTVLKEQIKNWIKESQSFDIIKGKGVKRLHIIA